MSWVYGIQSGLFIKVGMTENIATRLKTMNLYNPHPRKVIARRRVHELAGRVELRMHKVLAPYAIGREWFAVDAALVRAALTLVIKQVQAEQSEWIESSTKREELKHSRRLQKGEVSDSDKKGRVLQ
jgi:hypothetical protein